MNLIYPILAAVEWPSAVVALALILFLGVLMCVALARFNMDEVLKLWAALGTIAGLIVGTFGTYFFTREATQARIQAAQAQSATELRFAQTQLHAYKTASDAIKPKLSPEDAKWFSEMIYTPTVDRSQKTPMPNLKGQFPFYLNLKSPTPSPSP
jgi:hypothetical protein